MPITSRIRDIIASRQKWAHSYSRGKTFLFAAPALLLLPEEPTLTRLPPPTYLLLILFGQ